MNLLYQFLRYASTVILASAICYCYYHAFLRNKPFHTFNRWFLLAIPFFSLALPFIHLPVGGSLWPADPISAQWSAALHSVTNDNWKETDPTTGPAAWWSSLPSLPALVAMIFALVAAIRLYSFLRQLNYIRLLTKRYKKEEIGNIHFYVTREQGAPFSFLNLIFWDDQLDRNSPGGTQILRHEQNHVKQGHSIDLLLLRPLTALCWINPFFHLIYREIRAVHEFLADKAAISKGCRLQYAELLVWQTVRNPPGSLLHHFFYSPIKRRISMITQTRSTRPRFISRAMILPLLLLLFCAFAGRPHPDPKLRSKTADKPLTVVIDAGHGGIDPGAVTHTGISEKDLNLAIAEKVKRLAGEYNVRVLMTREDDHLAGNKPTIRESLQYRTEMANDNKADLFIAIHSDMLSRDDASGFNIFVSKKNTHYSECVRLGSILAENLKNSYTTASTLKQREEGIWVLAKSDMPAVLLICGNINNEKDLAFISKEDNQEKLARDILQGIRQYAAAKGQ